MKTTVDARLTRDPRYLQAAARLTELKTELNTLSTAHDEAMTGLGRFPTNSDRLNDEASAMLSGTDNQSTTTKAAILKTLEDLQHRREVLRRAVEMQSAAVSSLAAEISKQIAADMLPRHKEIVAEMIDAAIKLAAIVDSEADLREQLSQNGVAFTGVIRPLPLRGITTRDNQSQLSRLILEAEVYGYMRAADVPAILRPHIVPRGKPAPAAVVAGRKHSESDWTATE